MTADMQSWSNWSGSQRTQAAFLQPYHVDHLADIVRSQQKIRVVGAAHSFSPLINTEHAILNLDFIKGIAHVDEKTCQSTIWAGTRLYDLGEKLTEFNQALINQGDIDRQSLAGAIATGTHGTGIGLGCLSSLVTHFDLMTAEGEVLSCSQTQNVDIFAAGRVALGSLGILLKITMQNRPMYRLKEQIRLCSLQDVYQSLDTWKHQHRHIEFLAFLHADHVVLKTLDETDDAVASRPNSWPDEDFLLNLCCEMNRSMPWLNPYLQKLLGVFIQPSQYVDWSSRIFPSPRDTRFNEMEYQLPVQHGLACFEEILSVLKKHKVPMFFPIEFRYVKADDIWLSPFYQRDSVSISIHQFYKQNYATIFDLVEPIFFKHGGRPHWGKLHSLGAEQLQSLYPKWDDFMRVRQQLDPTQKWLNTYLEQLFFAKKIMN